MLLHRQYGNRLLFLRAVLIVGLALALTLALAMPGLAVDIRTSENVVIGAEEVIDDDLILSGSTVVVDGRVNGDLIAVGNRVTINGTVNGSLVVAGQALTVNGTVTGSTYSGGAELQLGPNAHIGRNVYFGGYSYQAAGGSTIGRDNLVAGYQGVFNGEVGRSLFAALGALELNGRVAGDVLVTVERPDEGTAFVFPMFFGGQQLPAPLPSGLRVGPEAQVGGTFNYTSPVDQSGAIRSIPGGGVVFSTPVPAPDGATLSAPVVAPAVTVPTAAAVRNQAILGWFAGRARHLVSLLIVAVLALWLLPRFVRRSSEEVAAHPLPASGWGLLVVLLGYSLAAAATIVLLMIVMGLSSLTLAGLAISTFGTGFSAVGLALSLFSVFTIYISKLIVVYPLAHAALARTIPAWNRYRIVPATLGILVFVLLRGIPWFGFLLSVVISIVGMGAMWMVLRARFGRVSSAPPILTPVPAG